MKKFWEKHSLGKALAILTAIVIVLTWIIPVGTFSGAEFSKIDITRIGITDISGLFYNVTGLCVDKIVFLVVLGAFYGILSKVKAYRVLVGKIANKMKGKEILFACIVSFVLALLSAFFTSTFAVLVFVPFVISILSAMKFDKLTTIAVSFGSILVGAIGCIFGTDGLFGLDDLMITYSSQDFISDGWIPRLIIFIGAFGLFTLFNVRHMKKALKDKKAEKATDLFEVEEEKDKVKLWPVVTILSFIGLITILGFVNWERCFGIEIFTKFHEWLVGLSVSDHAIMSYILGHNALAFSYFTLFTIEAVLIFFGIILMIMGKVKLNEGIENAVDGAKKMFKPALVVCAVYFIFSITSAVCMSNAFTSVLMKVDGKPNVNIDYKGSGIAYFNVDTDDDGKADSNLVGTGKKCKINCDTNNDGWPDKNLDFDGNGKVDENDKVIASTFTGQSVLNLDVDGDGIPDINVDTNVSLPGTILNSFLIGTLQSDAPYYNPSIYQYLYFGYYATNFNGSLGLIFLITVTMFAFAALFVPTSAVLAVGLCYTDVEYKDWLKYAWKLIASILAFLIVVYIFQIII